MGVLVFVVASPPTAALAALFAGAAPVVEADGARTRRKRQGRRMLTRQPPLITQSHRPGAAGKEWQEVPWLVEQCAELLQVFNSLLN